MRRVEALERVEWFAVIPKSYDPHVPHPVLMIFHEDLDTPLRTLDLTGFDRWAEERGVVILMPEDRAMRAWRGLDELNVALDVLSLSEEQLCLETSGGVFAYGHGTGGRAVERLHCVLPVRAAAASAHRPERNERFCEPAEAQPFLLISPIEDGYDPVAGGTGCGAAKIALTEFEHRWRRRNTCTEKSTKRRVDGGVCFEWDCSVEFQSCHAEGGHRLPGQKIRGADIQDCDGGAMTLPLAAVVWGFFDSFSG